MTLGLRVDYSKQDRTGRDRTGQVIIRLDERQNRRGRHKADYSRLDGTGLDIVGLKSIG